MIGLIRAADCSGPTGSQAIAIVGAGNLLLSDDGVGIHALRRLRGDRRIESVARLVDAGAAGTSLFAEVAGCERLLIIDAVEAGLAPGATVWMDFSLPAPQNIHMRNAHQSGIPGLVDDLRLLGREPRDLLLIGVQPSNMACGTELSPEVAGAIPALVGEIVRQVERWIAGNGIRNGAA